MALPNQKLKALVNVVRNNRLQHVASQSYSFYNRLLSLLYALTMKSSGFSLLEILLSMSLIALFAVVVVPKFDSLSFAAENKQNEVHEADIKAHIQLVRNRAILRGKACGNNNNNNDYDFYTGKLSSYCYPISANASSGNVIMRLPSGNVTVRYTCSDSLDCYQSM